MNAGFVLAELDLAPDPRAISSIRIIPNSTLLIIRVRSLRL